MLTKTPPSLSDGTRIDDLIHLQTREVQLRVLADPELHRLEMDRIFSQTWLFLGVANEIPNPGDFMVRSMGDDQVIVTRSRDGEVNVLLNVCPHRGMRVCTTEAGNTPVHKCIYHGWAFRPNGDFIGSPVEKEQMHGHILPKSELGLRRARVKVYGTLIFATWNLEGPSFDDFLGDMKFYYDMLFCRSDGGLEALGPPQKFTLHANWKTAGEQSACDGFHTLTLHRWLGDFAKFGDGDLTTSMYGTEVSANGHSMRCPPVAQKFKKLGLEDKSIEEKLELLPPPGVTKEMLPELKRRLSSEQLRLLVESPPQVGGIFPNLMVAFIYVPQPDGTVVGVTSLHAYVPRGPDKVEFTNWFLAERDVSLEMKQKSLQIGIRMLGTSGQIEQDDSDTWPHMSRNARGPQGRLSTMKYQAVCNQPPRPDWPGPGHVYEGFTKDDTQWNWWLKWHELMSATI
ncbi:MAG TPA: aromatic ring-hydroxylating dioxygenase subunit alpha [Caulobacteraceae bacterium]|jgi:nitrite reductase/ring-hydroxylating ferredoxin subunit